MVNFQPSTRKSTHPTLYHIAYHINDDDDDSASNHNGSLLLSAVDFFTNRQKWFIMKYSLQYQLRHYARRCLKKIRCRRTTIAVSAGFILGLFLLIHNWRDFGYVTRPIWDKRSKPWTSVKHFYDPRIHLPELCLLHGWSARPNAATYLDSTQTNAEPDGQLKVWDATLFSSELDLLEIRLRELWDVVDHFIIIEANLTFTGRAKPLHFCHHRVTERFHWAHTKIIYKQVALTTPEASTVSPADLAWQNEGKMRSQINTILRVNGIRNGDLIIQSDVDEIPSRATIALLRTCQGYPDTLHLSLRSFIYSFAFSLPHPTVAASVKTYNASDSWYYSHQRHSDTILEDAGWHCSFCFRYLSDFRAKMTGFSHFDRVTSPEEQLRDAEIQRKICEGDDIFDMFPEVYTFREMVAEFWRAYPETKSFVNMPTWLMQNANRFRFLLPGGCVREMEDPKGGLKFC
ncbi:hypothetical protein BV898_08482 [Hypsibius exemplaris]|uniref:Beta-1,4-mannosyl-glycoprotein 4-beta-N-acetylglucosaminyltransferase n=1 Tax=Hypsibius exemplaris TaxID=2072580 RepID=A0A1W0WQF1_HYPEX|nr:hypothetical protein BV898_08482 [Hypsibius exemplaris]